MSEGEKDFFFTHGYDLDVLATMELYKMSVSSYEKICYALSFLTDRTGWAAVNTWGLGEKIAQLSDAIEHMVLKHDERCREFDAADELAMSRALPLFLGTRPSDNLVYGHTHRAYCRDTADGRMIANTGCWQGRTGKECGRVNTFVKIENGMMSVCNYKGENDLSQCR